MSSTESIIQWRVFCLRCLIVAKANPGPGDWAAYAGVVPGKNLDNEYEAVLREGNKVPQKVAELYFPNIAQQFQWRR